VLGLQPGEKRAGLPHLRSEPVLFFVLPAIRWQARLKALEGILSDFILSVKEKTFRNRQQRTIFSLTAISA